MRHNNKKWKNKGTVTINKNEIGTSAFLGIPRRLANAHHSCILNAMKTFVNPKHKNRLYIKPNALIISEKFYSPRCGSFERSMAEPTTVIEAMINKIEKHKELTPSK